MYVISFISTWLKDIVVLFILISIAEIIMPKGSMKKYINMVIGLLIIFTIISPFAKLLKLNFNLDQTVFNYSKSSIHESNEYNEIYSQQEKQIEKLYKEKISNEVTRIVEEKTDFKVVDIVVEIIDKEESFGQIDYLTIVIGEETHPVSKNIIHIEKVKPVEINKDLKNIEDVDGEYEDLKDIISESYLVDKNRINIKMYKKGKGE